MRPNILCIASEDCPPLLSAYGNTLALTPHLDRLAARSVIFDNAYCTSPVCGPSRFSILTGRHAEASGPAHHMRSAGPIPPDAVTVPEMLRRAGYHCTNTSKTDYNCDIDPARIWDGCGPEAHWRDRAEGQPFFAIFNSMLTHESCVFDPGEGRVRPEDVRVPPHLPDTPGMRETMARYYDAVRRMDEDLGARLDELEAAGLGDDTIVLYYSDHASPLPRSKRFCYDDGLRVPLVLHLPRRWRHLLPKGPVERIADPVSLVDLLPSLAEMAGIAPPAGHHGQPFVGPARAPRQYAFSGRDRMDERYDLTRTIRSGRYRYIRNYAPHRIWGQHYAFAWLGAAYQDYERLMLENRLTPIEARFWRRKPAEELYDCAADPDALTNLADDPAHAGTLADMRTALDGCMLDIRDMGFIPESSEIETPEAARDPARYPLEEVIALAGRAIRRDPENAEHFVALLEGEAMILRYWAAQGLLMLAVEGHAIPPLRDRLDAEPSPHVRIQLAEAVGHAEDTDAATEALLAQVDDPGNGRLRLQALNALTYLPTRPEAVLPRVTPLRDHHDPYIRGAAEFLRLMLEGHYEPSAVIFRMDLMGPAAMPLRAPAGR